MDETEKTRYIEMQTKDTARFEAEMMTWKLIEGNTPKTGDSLNYGSYRATELS